MLYITLAFIYFSLGQGLLVCVQNKYLFLANVNKYPFTPNVK